MNRHGSGYSNDRDRLEVALSLHGCDPKGNCADHLRAVATARAHELTEDNLAITDRIFPLPEPSARLAM